MALWSLHLGSNSFCRSCKDWVHKKHSGIKERLRVGIQQSFFIFINVQQGLVRVVENFCNLGGILGSED